ncbi:MAG: hypothetical protein AAB721_02750 [Patescibacteria group bacterium]
MASVESVTNAVKALAADLKSQGRDPAEGALLLHVAVGVMQQEWTAATSAMAEHSAGLVLESRAALPAGKTVLEQREEVALLLKRRAEDVKASDVLATLKSKD